jgi:hypothetical protein
MVHGEVGWREGDAMLLLLFSACLHACMHFLPSHKLSIWVQRSLGFNHIPQVCVESPRFVPEFLREMRSLEHLIVSLCSEHSPALNE